MTPKTKEHLKALGVCLLIGTPACMAVKFTLGLTTDGYDPEVATTAIALGMLAAFLAVWLTRSAPWAWIKRQWFTPLAGFVLASYINEALTEEFTAPRLNAMLWVFNAWVFYQGALMWRKNSDWWVEAARKERDLADRWKKLYYQSEEEAETFRTDSERPGLRFMLGKPTTDQK